MRTMIQRYSCWLCCYVPCLCTTVWAALMKAHLPTFHSSLIFQSPFKPTNLTRLPKANSTVNQMSSPNTFPLSCGSFVTSLYNQSTMKATKLLRKTTWRIPSANKRALPSQQKERIKSDASSNISLKTVIARLQSGLSKTKGNSRDLLKSPKVN